MCDLAETYGIYDYRQIRGRTLATLVTGLRPSSRIWQEISGQKWTTEQLMLGKIYDMTALLAWMNTKDAQHGRNRPKSLFEAMTSKPEETGVQGYATGEEFEAARQIILEGMNNA